MTTAFLCICRSHQPKAKNRLCDVRETHKSQFDTATDVLPVSADDMPRTTTRRHAGLVTQPCGTLHQRYVADQSNAGNQCRQACWGDPAILPTTSACRSLRRSKQHRQTRDRGRQPASSVNAALDILWRPARISTAGNRPSRTMRSIVIRLQPSALAAYVSVSRRRSAGGPHGLPMKVSGRPSPARRGARNEAW